MTALVQASLLGLYVGIDALGAFGAVSITAGFATRVFNFLVDGVSAKTGKSVGLRDWKLVAARVRLSIGFACGAGIIAATTLAFLIKPVSVNVLKLSPDVQAEAEWYWMLRVALVPILLINMSISGILQGTYTCELINFLTVIVTLVSDDKKNTRSFRFQRPHTINTISMYSIPTGFRHVRTAASINSVQAIAEMTLSFFALRHRWTIITNHDGLLTMGVITLVTQLLAMVAGFTCMMMMPPLEAPPQYSLFKEIFSKMTTTTTMGGWGGGGAFNSRGKNANSNNSVPLERRVLDDNTVRQPLLGSDGGGGGRDGVDAAPVVLLTVGTPTINSSNGGRINARKMHTHMNGDASPAASSPSAVSLLYSPPSTEEDGEEEGVLHEAEEDESLLDFVKDGINMFVRSMILQATFFLTLVAASHLGTASLAAHSVINQLWVLISYGVDGFAAAGIVLGSRLAAQAHDPLRAANAKRHLQLLISRVLGAGLLAGIIAGVSFALRREFIISFFTVDAAVADELRNGTWFILSVSQPINGLVFVYDGLMYASQSFTFIRNYILLGFVVVFCPLLAGEMMYIKSLWAVWSANAFINLWRAAGAAYLIHYIFMKEFDTKLRSRSVSGVSLARDGGGGSGAHDEEEP